MNRDIPNIERSQAPGLQKICDADDAPRTRVTFPVHIPSWSSMLDARFDVVNRLIRRVLKSSTLFHAPDCRGSTYSKLTFLQFLGYLTLPEARGAYHQPRVKQPV